MLVGCPECGGAMVVCDCDEFGVAFDRFVSADGRCARCRPRDPDDVRDGLGGGRRSRSTHGRHDVGKRRPQ